MAATAAAHDWPASPVTTVNRPLPVRSSVAETRLPFPIAEPRMGHLRTWPRRSPPDRSPRVQQKTAAAERPPRPRRLQVDPAPPRNRCRARRPRPDRRAAARRCHRVPAYPGRRPLRPCNGMTVVAEAEIRGHWAGRRDHAGVDRADRSETRAVTAGITETGPTLPETGQQPT